MFRIYPLHEAALELEERYRDYLDKGGQYLHTLSFTVPDGSTVIVDQLPKPSEYIDLLLAAVNDRLNELLEWASPTQALLDGVDQMFPLYQRVNSPKNNPMFAEASESFFELVVMPIEDRVIDWFEDALGDEPDALWRIWHVRMIGSDVLLERGIDFRIYDWENRMKNGDWKREEKSHILDD